MLLGQAKNPISKDTVFDFLAKFINDSALQIYYTLGFSFRFSIEKVEVVQLDWRKLIFSTYMWSLPRVDSENLNI